MKKITTLLMIISLAISGSLMAQGEGTHLTTLSWNIGMPTGNLKDFLVNEDISFGGMSIDYKHMYTDYVSFGFYLGWDFYNGSTREPFSADNVDITGLRLFYVNSFPMMATAHYFFNDNGDIRPFLGAGLGTTRTLQRTEFGVLAAVQNDNWHLGMYPEFGLIIPSGTRGALTLSTKYNLAIETSDSFTYSYVSFHIGFTGFVR